jgi:hypothetical protein
MTVRGLSVFDKSRKDSSVRAKRYTLVNQEPVLTKGLGSSSVRAKRRYTLATSLPSVSINNRRDSSVFGFTDRYALANFVKRERIARSISIVPAKRFMRNSWNDRNLESLPSVSINNRRGLDRVYSLSRSSNLFTKRYTLVNQEPVLTKGLGSSSVFTKRCANATRKRCASLDASTLANALIRIYLV